MLTAEQAKIRFERTMTLLRDAEASFTADAIYCLSDLDGDQLTTFRAAWPDLSIKRRRDLIARLVETAETNFELDFSAIIEPALNDPDHDVRIAAIEGILEDSSLATVRRLMRLAQDDTVTSVRAAAAKALGQFVLRGELGKLREPFNTELQDAVLALHNDAKQPLDVRRRALEAISNCGRDEVNDLIRKAYFTGELTMRASAVYAMGRSYDVAWTPQIIAELSSDYSEMRYEAARAAGELELRPALTRLAELAHEEDREIQEMAVWALGEIGSKEAARVLSHLEELADSTEDDELADAVAEAKSAAALSGSELVPLFDFNDFEDDEEDEELDYLLGLDGPDGVDGEDYEDYLEDEEEDVYGDMDY